MKIGIKIRSSYDEDYATFRALQYLSCINAGCKNKYGYNLILAEPKLKLRKYLCDGIIKLGRYVEVMIDDGHIMTFMNKFLNNNVYILEDFGYRSDSIFVINGEV